MRGATILAAAALVAMGCRGGMGKIEKLRDALADDDSAALSDLGGGFPSCKRAPNTDEPCLGEIAKAFGSKNGYNAKPPDQAAAATAALVLARDKRGDWLGVADAWMPGIRVGKGPGADALRLATARRMAEASPAVGRKIDEEKDALAMLKAIGEAIPGACPTYAALGGGADPKVMRPEAQADHSPCVQRISGERTARAGRMARGRGAPPKARSRCGKRRRARCGRGSQSPVGSLGERSSRSSPRSTRRVQPRR
jgi:hypothetical protein